MKKSTQIILILVTILFVAAVVFGGYALVGKINDANTIAKVTWSRFNSTI